MPSAWCKSRLPLAVRAFLLLVCSALATPAQARTCDQYDSAMTATDLAEIRNQVRSYLPARYFDTIGHLVFEMVEPNDRDSIFPRAMPSLNRIEIPSDYYRVHCLMINFTERLMRIPQGRSMEVLLSLLQAHRNCLRYSNFNLCFRRMLQTEIADLEPGSSDEAAATARVRDAFFLVIAHEIAHVLIRQLNSDRLLNALDNAELAADALALQAAILAGRDYRQAGSTLFPASFFDDRGIEFEAGRTELILTNRADSSCRSALAFATGESWGPEISTMHRWAINQPADTGAGPALPSLTAEADRTRQQIRRTGTDGLDFPAICQLPSSQIDARGRDYRSILVAIDGANISHANPDFMFRSLLRLQPQSDAARSFLQTVIVYRITNEIMAAYERRDVALERQLFQTLLQIAPQIDRDSISSLARGMLSMFLGLNRERFAPEGSSLDEVISTAEAELLDAERFLVDAPITSLGVQIARFRLLQGDCAGANRRFTLLRNSTDTGIASEAQRYSYLEGMSRSSCAAVIAQLRSELRTRRGWR